MFLRKKFLFRAWNWIISTFENSWFKVGNGIAHNLYKWNLVCETRLSHAGHGLIKSLLLKSEKCFIELEKSAVFLHKKTLIQHIKYLIHMWKK